MARPGLSPAKAVLLAVQLACEANLSTFRTLLFQHRKTLRNEIVLRIILNHLPESLEPSLYVPLLQDLVTGNIVEDPEIQVDTSAFEELSEKEAAKKVRKLHLLPLAWPNAPADAPEDPIVLFLIHRALRIDENTGLITQIPELLAPFLHLSQYLRTWLITSVLPLLRLNYEYHPTDIPNISIPSFERLSDAAGINLLLSKTGSSDNKDAVGRDLRGLIGPWMYGDTRQKRRRLRKNSSFSAQTVAPLDEAPVANQKCASWEEVFKWITAQATTSWKTAVEVIEQWDGPGDVDLGGYEDGTEWLDEEDQQHLERRYARSALAVAYLVPDSSLEALEGIHRIVSRIIVLLDLDRIPTLEVSGVLLSPITGVDILLSSKNGSFLRNGLLEDSNTLTKPVEASLRLLHGLLVSAYLFTRERVNMNLKRVAELALLQHESEQRMELGRLLKSGLALGQKGDDKHWMRMRNSILWLRSWGAEELGEGGDAEYGKGVLGKIPKEEIEVSILKTLLSNNRIVLAQSIYEKSPDRPLARKVLQDTLISAAMEAYDNATNANMTRGGVKKCHDILKAFPDTLVDSLDADRMEHLIVVTHRVGAYRLVFKQGEPFTPVILRVHGDPISILGKVLEQNSRSYTKINDFIAMGQLMVKAGLTVRNTVGQTAITEEEEKHQQVIAEKRVVSMCIDAALGEDDFETAYSYVMTRLSEVAGPAHSRTPDMSRKEGLYFERAPTVLDDWSWKAALQAGKYRRTSNTVKPTHLGNSSGNLEIRHLEQRMDCLSLALRCAPSSALQEILNAYRRCEEELETQVKQEAEQEAAWDAQGDDQAMPGGFISPKARKENLSGSSTRPAEEAPMSLFDLSRASMARAQSGLSALTLLQGNKKPEPAQSRGTEESRTSTPDSGMQRERKRDQLRNAAVGTLASGVGWLIGAPAPPREEHDM